MKTTDEIRKIGQGIDLAGLSDFAMDAVKADFSEMLSKFEELINKRDKIRKFLTQKCFAG